MAESRFTALNSPRVSPGFPRRDQVPQSKLSAQIPKGQNNAGMKIKGGKK